MGQHVSESSLLFSFSSPLQLVLHSRYKKKLTKFRGRQRFLVHSKRRWGPPGTQTSQDLGLEKLKYGKDYDHFTAATISLLTLRKGLECRRLDNNLPIMSTLLCIQSHSACKQNYHNSCTTLKSATPIY